MRWTLRLAFMTVLALGLGAKLLAPTASTLPEPASPDRFRTGPKVR